MKITRDKALAMTAYCRKHKIKYVNQGTYPNTVKSALRSDTKAPNGVRIHFPRDWTQKDHKTQEHMLVENPRAYVLWQGEPVELIEEAFAYILMVTRDKELYLVRCKHASQGAEHVEAFVPIHNELLPENQS